MEPFLAIGKLLKEKGHQVISAFQEQFRSLAQDSNMEFASLGRKFIKMLDSDVGKAAPGGSGSRLKKILAYIKLAAKQKEINKELVDKQYELIEREDPDRIVYNGKATYSIIWELNNRGKTILVSSVPFVHYVKNQTHVAFNSNFGLILNKLTYSLANFGMITTVNISAKWLKMERKITRKQKKALLSNNVIYTVSPSLFSRPDYLNEKMKISGCYEHNKEINWQSNQDLDIFLEKHKYNRILFITFGSMTNPEPEKKTKILIEILEH